MTHDELLAKIGQYQNSAEQDHIFDKEPYQALRAVVELHKPEHSVRGYRCVFDDEAFPCFHHHLIEEQLK